MEWSAQSATFMVVYRESGAPNYHVIVSRTSQLSQNISSLQPNTLYNIVVEATIVTFKLAHRVVYMVTQSQVL